MRISVTVNGRNVATVLDSLSRIGAESIMVEPDDMPNPTRNGGVSVDAADETDEPTTATTRNVSKVRRVNASARTSRAGKRVLYSLAGTKRQIDKLLAELRGDHSLNAAIIRDIAKHGEVENRDVCARLLKAKIVKPSVDAKGNLPSVGSVDNLIWRGWAKTGVLAKKYADR